MRLHICNIQHIRQKPEKNVQRIFMGIIQIIQK